MIEAHPAELLESAYRRFLQGSASDLIALLSPVIWLCRELKKRGAFPDPELIQWIKENTDNKFLPYGNLLDL